MYVRSSLLDVSVETYIDSSDAIYVGPKLPWCESVTGHSVYGFSVYGSFLDCCDLSSVDQPVHLQLCAH